ncbi:MAG: 30S ribosomal protein S20 [Candidatus Hydrogenedentota bacterium]
MPNLKSQKKRVLTNELARKRNVAVRSRIKTFSKNAEDAIAAKNAEAINTTLTTALREIDRAVQKGVIHTNSAARKKAHLQHSAAAILKG